MECRYRESGWRLISPCEFLMGLALQALRYCREEKVQELPALTYQLLLLANKGMKGSTLKVGGLFRSSEWF
jgi:hypothetical protein